MTGIAANRFRRSMTANAMTAPILRKCTYSAKELKKEKTGGAPRWKLRLEIGRDQASGPFPRSDNEVYKDTAIDLKIGGEGA